MYKLLRIFFLRFWVIGCCNYCYFCYTRLWEPVGGDGSEVEDEVMVDELFRVFGETLLLLERSYCTAARDRLTEMNVDRWTSRRLNSLQLARRRYVKSLHISDTHR